MLIKYEYARGRFRIIQNQHFVISKNIYSYRGKAGEYFYFCVWHSLECCGIFALL